ncbi:hypothetical protein FGB62_28g229 [Gracilaria domingensis]|nr:hypothetical protein FGB62_28g229 [Gracilaria domingensis]
MLLLPPTPILFCFWSLFFLLSVKASEPGIRVTYDDVNVILNELHEYWPPFSTPPPSSASGLTSDICNGSNECVEPRVCMNCEFPPCHCVKSPVYANYSCTSSMGCDEGEHCEWDPLVGIASGVCVSSKYYEGERRPILSTPIDSVPSLLGLGLTGDRCFSHKECRGTRSCLAESVFQHEVYHLTPCESSFFSCVCMPLDFAPCSNSSDCMHVDEICASVWFYPANTFSHRSDNDDEEALLEPICVSSSFFQHESVLPVWNNSSTSEFFDLPIAELEVQRLEQDKQTSPPVLTDPDNIPFSVPELPFFNSFSINELSNEFIGGILSLIVVSQLHKLVKGLSYNFPGIKHSAYSSYITFSRFNSFRSIFRLFSIREPYAGPGHTPLTRGTQPTIQTSRQLLLRPFAALISLFAIELASIVAGTNTRSEYYAVQNFDPVVAPIQGTPRARVQHTSNQYCDDFFVSTRGLFESGNVLKCVKPFPRDPDEAVTDIIRVSVLFGSGKTLFEMHSLNGTYSAVELSTFLRSQSGMTMRTMPFRPDLMARHNLTLFLNNMMNGVRRRLGYEEIDVRLPVWSTIQLVGPSDRLESIEFAHRPNWNDSLETITEAVMLGLRDLDLVLNSTGQPWIYTKPYTFEQQNPLMAIVKPYRISHGWLLVFALLVTVVHIVINSYVTHFEDVAYVAMKELMGDDCVLGPLVESNSNTTEVDLNN